MARSKFMFRGVEFDVDYDFYPEEKQYFNATIGVGHPGSPAFVELLSFAIGECEFYDLLTKDAIDLIENALLLDILS